MKAVLVCDVGERDDSAIWRLEAEPTLCHLDLLALPLAKVLHVPTLLCGDLVACFVSGTRTLNLSLKLEFRVENKDMQ